MGMGTLGLLVKLILNSSSETFVSAIPALQQGSPRSELVKVLFDMVNKEGVIQVRLSRMVTIISCLTGSPDSWNTGEREDDAAGFTGRAHHEERPKAHTSVLEVWLDPGRPRWRPG